MRFVLVVCGAFAVLVLLTGGYLLGVSSATRATFDTFVVSEVPCPDGAPPNKMLCIDLERLAVETSVDNLKRRLKGN